MNEGILDTNVFLHAHTSDDHARECQRLLTAVATGNQVAVLDPLVAHELSYALPRLRKQMTRADIADYLLQVLSWDGIRGETDLLTDTIRIWRAATGIGFVDAYLAARGRRESRPIYTKNRRHFEGRGVVLPDPLSDSN